VGIRRFHHPPTKAEYRHSNCGLTSQGTYSIRTFAVDRRVVGKWRDRESDEMTVRDLQSKLSGLGVRSDSYCLLDDSNEAYCLQQARAGWYVYYSERGLQSGRKDFDSESEAVSIFWIFFEMIRIIVVEICIENGVILCLSVQESRMPLATTFVSEFDH
jgi:hypothetical protein